LEKKNSPQNDIIEVLNEGLTDDSNYELLRKKLYEIELNNKKVFYP
jgi:hypothetical protein